MTNPFAKSKSAPSETTADTKVDTKVDTKKDTAPSAADALGGDPFASAVGVSGEYITEFVGKTLLVKPTEYIREMSTSQGKSDAMRVDVAVLDDAEEPGKIVRGVLLFQQALKREAKARMEAPDFSRFPYILGVLNKGKTGNGNTLYTFLPTTDEDIALGRAFLEHFGATAL